ncbi:UNVERIFIED_CONTAM: ATPase family associated with various cellular activities (AAA) subfamily protein [Hammondia hammondi]|eukprot:XP_008884414.1 ATPase family associated with various cellular activities (AAA) subfamily protein [Hammondia hammondi]
MASETSSVAADIAAALLPLVRALLQDVSEQLRVGDLKDSLRRVGGRGHSKDIPVQDGVLRDRAVASGEAPGPGVSRKRQKNRSVPLAESSDESAPYPPYAETGQTCTMERTLVDSGGAIPSAESSHTSIGARSVTSRDSVFGRLPEDVKLYTYRCRARLHALVSLLESGGSTFPCENSGGPSPFCSDSLSTSIETEFLSCLRDLLVSPVTSEAAVRHCPRLSTVAAASLLLSCSTFQRNVCFGSRSVSAPGTNVPAQKRTPRPPSHSSQQLGGSKPTEPTFECMEKSVRMRDGPAPASADSTGPYSSRGGDETLQATRSACLSILAARLLSDRVLGSVASEYVGRTLLVATTTALKGGEPSENERSKRNGAPKRRSSADSSCVTDPEDAIRKLLRSFCLRQHEKTGEAAQAGVVRVKSEGGTSGPDAGDCSSSSESKSTVTGGSCHVSLDGSLTDEEHFWARQCLIVLRRFLLGRDCHNETSVNRTSTGDETKTHEPTTSRGGKVTSQTSSIREQLRLSPVFFEICRVLRRSRDPLLAFLASRCLLSILKLKDTGHVNLRHSSILCHIKATETDRTAASDSGSESLRTSVELKRFFSTDIDSFREAELFFGVTGDTVLGSDEASSLPFRCVFPSLTFLSSLLERRALARLPVLRRAASLAATGFANVTEFTSNFESLWSSSLSLASENDDTRSHQLTPQAERSIRKSSANSPTTTFLPLVSTATARLLVDRLRCCCVAGQDAQGRSRPAILIHGPSGSGKTSLIRWVADIVGQQQPPVSFFLDDQTDAKTLIGEWGKNTTFVQRAQLGRWAERV